VTAFYAQKFSSDIQTTISFTTFVKDFFYENKWIILILASLSMFYIFRDHSSYDQARETILCAGLR